MNKKKDFKDTHSSVSTHWNQVYTRGAPLTKGGWLEGVIILPDGIVSAISDNGSFEFTMLRFVFRGVIYTRRWKRSWSKRTLVLLAKQLVNDVLTELDKEKHNEDIRKSS